MIIVLKKHFLLLTYNCAKQKQEDNAYSMYLLVIAEAFKRDSIPFLGNSAAIFISSDLSFLDFAPQQSETIESEAIATW